MGCNVGHGYSHTIALAIQKASAAKDGLKSPELRTDDKIRPLKLDSSGDSRDLASAAVSDGPKSETEVNETPVEPILETEENATPTTNDEPKLKLEDPISDERLASPNISYPPVIV